MAASDPLPFPPPVTVHLRHEEVIADALASRSRGQGTSIWSGWLLLALLALAIWIGLIASFWLVQQLPFAVMVALGPYLPVVLPALLGLAAVSIALRVEQARANRAYLRHLARVGSPLERSGTYEVTPEALVLTTERIVIAPRWEAIDTVEKGTHGWVISADQLHFLIPYAAFPDADAQRPLLAAITARMTPDARARSREAVDFAAVVPERTARPEPANSPWSNPEPMVGQEGAAELPVAQGWLTQEQAGWAAGVMQGKVAHPGFHRWSFPLTGGVTGLLCGLVVLGLVFVLVPMDMVLGYAALFYVLALAIPLLGGALGLAYGLRRLGIVIDKAWRGGLVARGTPEQVEAVWRLTDTGLSYETARFTGEAAYASIHQLLHEHGYWIAGTDALTLCIPDTAFASADDASAFMAALLERMDAPARERSVSL